MALARPSLALPWLAAGSLLPPLPPAAWPTQHYQLLVHAEGACGAAHFAHWLRALCERVQAEAQEELSRRALKNLPRAPAAGSTSIASTIPTNGDDACP